MPVPPQIQTGTSHSCSHHRCSHNRCSHNRCSHNNCSHNRCSHNNCSQTCPIFRTLTSCFNWPIFRRLRLNIQPNIKSVVKTQVIILNNKVERSPLDYSSRLILPASRMESLRGHSVTSMPRCPYWTPILER